MSQLERFADRYELPAHQLRRWLVEAMVLGAAADGNIGRREGEEIALLVSTEAAFAEVEPGELQETLRSTMEALRRDGFVPRVHALAGALPRYAHRVLAFRAAVRVAMANGSIQPEEIGLLREMQGVFGITENDVGRAFEDSDQAGNAVPSAVEPIEAYLDCMLMAAACDGQVSDHEHATIVAFVISRPELEALDGGLLQDYIAKNAQTFTSSSARTARLENLVNDLPLPEHRENAWGLAIQVVSSDSDLNAKERAFLSALEEALDMESTRSTLVGELATEA